MGILTFLALYSSRGMCFSSAYSKNKIVYIDLYFHLALQCYSPIVVFNLGDMVNFNTVHIVSQKPNLVFNLLMEIWPLIRDDNYSI